MKRDWFNVMKGIDADFCEGCERKMRSQDTLSKSMCNECASPTPIGYQVMKSYTDETGAPMHQPPMQQPPMQPQEEEKEEKPLYDQKQQLSIAHYLVDDIEQIAETIRRDSHPETALSTAPEWERLTFDIKRLKQILEDALTGGGIKPSGGE